MRDPLDPENPYRDQYEDWDYWCYMNVRDPYSEETVNLYAGMGGPELFFADIGVDPQGFMVPLEQYYRQQMEWSIGNYDQENMVDCAASMSCAGPIDGGLRGELLALTSKIRAAYVLPVPEWLAQAPPQAAKYLPDGRFAVLGELGAGAEARAESVTGWWRPDAHGLAWRLYSADGELLKTGEPDEDWWQLLIEDYRKLLGIEEDAEVTSWEYNGMITVYNFATQEYCGTLAYDGTVLEGNWYEQDRGVDPRAFATLSGAEIPLIYKAQQYVEPREPVLAARP